MDAEACKTKYVAKQKVAPLLLLTDVSGHACFAWRCVTQGALRGLCR